MTIFIGADHRGFEFKNKLVEYLHEKNIRVEDMGPYEYNAEDDYTDSSKKVAAAVLQNPENNRGVVICGSGIGVSVMANRFKGIRCALAFNNDQVKHGRENDHINVIALPAEYISLEQAQEFIETFLATPPIEKEKYFRRNEKLDA